MGDDWDDAIDAPFDSIKPAFDDHTPVDGILHRFPPGTGRRMSGREATRPDGVPGSTKSAPYSAAELRIMIENAVNTGLPVDAQSHWGIGEARNIPISRGIVSTKLTPEQAKQILGDMIVKQSLRVPGTLKHDGISFPDSTGKVVVKLTVGDPPTVWVDESLAWDAAAKQFWNAVYRLIGKPALFKD